MKKNIEQWLNALGATGTRCHAQSQRLNLAKRDFSDVAIPQID
jgi:hypothetical protein